MESKLTRIFQGKGSSSLTIAEIKTLLCKSGRSVDHVAIEMIEAKFGARRVSEAAAGLIFIDFDQWFEGYLMNLFSLGKPALDSDSTIIEERQDDSLPSVS